MQRIYWAIFISNIPLNWDHYNPKDAFIPFSYFRFSTFTLFQKKKNWVLIYISEYSFLCTDLITCILLCSFHCNLILVFRSSLCRKIRTLVFLCSPPLRSSNTCILASSFIITHIYFLLTEKTMIFIKKENYKVLVLTEYMTGEKLLLFSFILSILFSSSCPLTSFSSSALSVFCSLCFFFSVLLSTSVSFS